jgi:hypothetical protein
MLVARSPLECQVYLALHPCTCGCADFPWTDHELSTEDTSTYSGSCPACGAPRSVTFSVPRALVPGFGGPSPSQLIGPEEFLDLAKRAIAHDDLDFATAALAEVLKFQTTDAGRDEARALLTACRMEL